MEATVLARPRGERALIWVGFPIVGVALGWLLPFLADWAVSLPWFPFQGPLELVASLPPLPVTVGGLVLGVAAGVVLALVSEAEYTTVTVDDAQVTITREESAQVVERSAVTAVFLDEKALVLLGRATEELARGAGELPAEARLREAFLAHGYPWLDGGDPYAEEYRRWVDGLPELSAAAHALFQARGKALEKEDKDDAEQLRVELARLGIVVRDRDGKQHWRLTEAD